MVLYKKNIILNILGSAFGDELEMYVYNYILQMKSEELEPYFGLEVDYALFDRFDRLIVENYEVKSEGEHEDFISGALEARSKIDAFVCSEEEPIYKGSMILPVGLWYEFRVKDETYTDLYLEYLY